MGIENKPNIPPSENGSLQPESHEDVKEVIFDSEGQKLHGKIFFPKQLKEKNPGVLFIYGWKGNQKK